MEKMTVLASLIIMASIVLTSCGGNAAAPKDLLGKITSRGYLLVSTDPNYAPQ